MRVELKLLVQRLVKDVVLGVSDRKHFSGLLGRGRRDICREVEEIYELAPNLRPYVVE